MHALRCLQCMLLKYTGEGLGRKHLLLCPLESRIVSGCERLGFKDGACMLSTQTTAPTQGPPRDVPTASMASKLGLLPLLISVPCVHLTSCAIDIYSS